MTLVSSGGDTSPCTITGGDLPIKAVKVSPGNRCHRVETCRGGGALLPVSEHPRALPSGASWAGGPCSGSPFLLLFSLHPLREQPCRPSRGPRGNLYRRPSQTQSSAKAWDGATLCPLCPQIKPQPDLLSMGACLPRASFPGAGAGCSQAGWQAASQEREPGPGRPPSQCQALC